MKSYKQFKVLAILVVASMILVACGGGAAVATQAPATQPPAATEAPSTEPAATESPAATASPVATEPAAAATGSGIFASDGFECPAAENKMDVQSTELNLFVWTEYIPQDMQECFEKVYNIKVNRDEYSANEEMYAKLSAGGTAYDLVQPTDYIVGPMVKNGLIQKLDQSKLPVLANFDPNYLNLSFDQGNEYTIPYEAGTDAIVYNADKVTTPPQSFADLWKPEYAGKLVMLDDSRATIGATLLTLGYDVNTKDPKQLNEAKAKLKELVPNVKLFDSDSPKTALIAGDVDLGMTWTGEAFLAQQEVSSIQYVYPTEGAMLWQDNWAMPKDAPHPDAAYAWLNYTMQGNVFWMMLRDFPYTNPNKAALDYAKGNSMDVNDVNGNATTLGAIYDAYINSPITNTPPEAIKNGHRIEDVGDTLPLYDQIWTEVKGQ
ncbi:MAG TPA: extracellular solute-binding protein [Anaerolineales bacterium]